GDRRMADQAALDLLRHEPAPADLEDVVGPAAVGEVAVLVAGEEIAGHHPLAAEGLGGLLHLLPVADGARAALDPEPPRLAGRQRVAVVVAGLDLEPRDRLAERPRPHVAR